MSSTRPGVAGVRVQEFHMFRRAARLGLNMQGELEGYLLVGPGVIVQGNGRADGFVVEKIEGVFKLVQKFPDSLAIRMHLAAFDGLDLDGLPIGCLEPVRDIFDSEDAIR